MDVKRSSASKRSGTKFLELPHTVRKSLKTCASRSNNASSLPVTYLWIVVTPTGIGGNTGGNGGAAPMSQEDWLNVVDEAASLGANWLVISFTTAVSHYPGALEICRWAQTTHGMMVGLHLFKGDLSEQDTESILSLDLTKLRLLVRSETVSDFSSLEQRGIAIWTANPQELQEGARPNCQGPARMIYVNSSGDLYTCGLVDGNPQYLMGSVLQEKLGKVITDPQQPHSVREDIHRIALECDGCPSLLANFFSYNT